MITTQEELWFTDIDEKVFSFKHKVNNWLSAGDRILENREKIKIMLEIYMLQVIQIIKFQIIEAINQRESHQREDRISRSSSRSNLHVEEKIC